MIVELTEKATPQEIRSIAEQLRSSGFQSTEVKTQLGHYLVAIGKQEIDIRTVGHMAGVRDVFRVSDAYKLVSRKWKVDPTEIDLGDGVKVRSGELSIMAGPCSIENEEQVLKIIRHLKDHGIEIMRGGVFKPRTSPYSFRGAGIDGLKMWFKLAREHGIKIVSEVLAPDQIGEMYDYIDMYQVGTRNSQNFSLLHELGNIDKPVVIKRGMSGTLEELLQSAEYIFANGNEKLLLCERGIRTFEQAYRNTLDLNAVPVLKEKSHLPVIVDPSHGMGVRRYIEPMALAAVMAGADGLLIEVHESPEEAYSDGDQTLNFAESARLIDKARKAAELRRAG